MTVDVKSNDGNAHSVQVYSDISAEWISGDNSLIATWSTDTSTNGLITHQVQLQNQQTYTERNDHIQRELLLIFVVHFTRLRFYAEGSAYYSMSGGDGVTYQTGQDSVVRSQFVSNGKLANTQDTNFRAVSDDWPVFGLSKDL
jgi:hypothetical protein